MSVDDKMTETTVNPNEFFESIGSKVEGFSGTANGDVAANEEEERRPVEEIESLCMNCGENVSCFRVLLEESHKSN